MGLECQSARENDIHGILQPTSNFFVNNELGFIWNSVSSRMFCGDPGRSREGEGRAMSDASSFIRQRRAESSRTEMLCTRE